MKKSASLLLFVVILVATYAISVNLAIGRLDPQPLLIVPETSTVVELPEFDVNDVITVAVATFSLLKGVPYLLSILGQIAVYLRWISVEQVRPITNLILATVFIGIFIGTIFGVVPIILQIDMSINGFVALLAQLLILLGIPISQAEFRLQYRLPPKLR